MADNSLSLSLSVVERCIESVFPKLFSGKTPVAPSETPVDNTFCFTQDLCFLGKTPFVSSKTPDDIR